MAGQPFGREYASYYDALYSDKDYRGEAKIVKGLLRRSAPEATTLLELGCGTGNYTRLMSKEFRVTAIERSSHMLRIARRKVDSTDVTFLRGDVTKVLHSINTRFDACVGLFHVVNYLKTEKELAALLREVRSHLERKGVLVFDSWNGDAVLSQRPVVRVKKARLGDKTVIRIAEPSLDTSTSSCDVLYRVLVARGKRLLSSFNENHRMRYYFPGELRDLLTKSGFASVKLVSYEIGIRPRDSWSILALARRL